MTAPQGQKTGGPLDAWLAQRLGGKPLAAWQLQKLNETLELARERSAFYRKALAGLPRRPLDRRRTCKTTRSPPPATWKQPGRRHFCAPRPSRWPGW